MTATLKDNAHFMAARNICLNLLKELIVRSSKYDLKQTQINTIQKAFFALEQMPQPYITGYIDISANTHLPGGSLDYSSFTIGADYLEIYTGFVEYGDSKSCDNSAWEKIFDSKDKEHRNSLHKALEVWAEGLLLHAENSSRGLLIIDRSDLIINPVVQA